MDRLTLSTIPQNRANHSAINPTMFNWPTSSVAVTATFASLLPSSMTLPTSTSRCTTLPVPGTPPRPHFCFFLFLPSKSPPTSKLTITSSTPSPLSSRPMSCLLPAPPPPPPPLLPPPHLLD